MTNNTPRRPRSPRNTPDQRATTEYTFDDAARDAAAQHQAEIIRSIEELTAAVERSTEALAKAKARRDRAVALSITSEPGRVNWYDHPGVLQRHQVAKAAKLSPVALSRVMERYRTQVAGGAGRKPTRARRATS